MRKAVAPGLISLLAAGYLLLFLLFTVQYDFSRLIHVGRKFTLPSLPSSIHAVYPIGYDGQFFYRLAIDPFTQAKCDHGLCLDWPRYRQQRILYPLLARLAALGRVDWLPYSLVLVNLVGLGAIGALGGMYCQSIGRSTWWGLLFSLYIGLLISFARDLSEITEMAFLLAGLVFLQKRRLSAGLLVLAVLARETTVFFAAAVLLVAWWQRWKGWAYYLLPAAVFVGWQLWLAWHWSDFRGYGHFFQFPGWAALQMLQQAWQYGPWEHLLLIPLLATLALLVVICLPGSRAPLYIKLAWLAYAGMYWCQGRHVWIDPISYLRVGVEWYSIGLLVLLNFRLSKIGVKATS